MNRLYFYSGWLLLSIIQAAFTQIQDDESYYWVFSKFPDWGYFDHPPLIALCVKIGSFLLGGTLGVRLVTVLMSTAIVYITERLVQPSKPVLFYALVASVAVLQLSSFWAVPDVPLMFFTAVYFLAFRAFLQKDSWRNTLFLSIAIAGMFYSKYHGILVVLFSFVAIPKLLRQHKTYLAALFTVIFYLPHLLWQYRHDWITFRFQLFENKAHPYQVNFTLDYLFGQLMIAGPLVGFILLTATFAFRTRSDFERSLKYTGIGILIFFLISSLRGQVEANWTSPALIPMLYIGYHFIEQRSKWRRWVWRLLPFSLAIVLFARVVMIFDILPVEVIVEKFHSWKNWPTTLAEKTAGKPVVFYNSYQRASMYWFHTGQQTYSLNSFDQRRNSYSFWPIEDSLLGKEVYRMNIYGVSEFADSLQATMWKVGFSPDKNYHSFARVQLQPEENDYKIEEGEMLAFNATVSIPPAHLNYLRSHSDINEQITLVFYNKQEVVKTIDLPISLRDIFKKQVIRTDVFPELPKGKYGFIFSVSSENNLFTHNSYKTNLVVE